MKKVSQIVLLLVVLFSLGIAVNPAWGKQIATEGKIVVNGANDLFVVNPEGGRVYFGHLNNDTVLMRIKNGAIKNISARELLALKKKIKVRGVTEEMEFAKKIPYSYLKNAPEYSEFYGHLYQTGRKVANCLLFIVIIE